MGNFRDARLEIGVWHVDPVKGEIRRGEEVARPDARAMRLLLHLASRPGEVFSIEELLDHVWPDVTVSQDSVYQAVASLRRLFRDDPKRPAYIVTVPRQGYRLVASVVRMDDQPAAAPKRAEYLSKRIAIAAGATIGIALVVLGSFRSAVAPPVAAGHPAAMNSVAVVPFIDLTSNGMNDEYVADGLTEELIDRLSGIPDVRVPAPTASFHFKGKRVTVGEFAHALHVAFVLDGSLRRSGSKLRIAVRFILGSSGTVLWSETFDRPADDILKVQDEVADDVAKRLKPCFLRHARRV